MSFRSSISLLLAILLSLTLVVPAYAGGWAVITLDELPSGAVAGEPLTVGFTVRQHGITRMTGLTPRVTAILPGEEKLIFSAEAKGEPGHYAATLTLPTAGEWQWAIEAFSMYQPMPALTVTSAGVAAVSPPEKQEESVSMTGSSVLPVSVAMISLGLLAAVIGFRRRSRAMIVSTALCLLAGIVLLVIGTGTTSGVQAQAKSEVAGESSISQVELGRQLFIAKGCITCHASSKAAQSSQYMTIEMGAPNLSNYSSSPEILMIRLKDPAAAKSDTKMPNLELKKTEIEALIAFINSK
jgi:cytochrome c2